MMHMLQNASYIFVFLAAANADDVVIVGTSTAAVVVVANAASVGFSRSNKTRK